LLLANVIGFIFNLGTFFTLISISPLCHSRPVLASIAGSTAGCTSIIFCRRSLFSIENGASNGTPATA